MPMSSAWTKRPPSRPSTGPIPRCRSLRDGPSVMDFECFHHGTLSLYAAVETGSGQVIASISSRHTSQEFVAFSKDSSPHNPRARKSTLSSTISSPTKPSSWIAFLSTTQTCRRVGCALLSKTKHFQTTLLQLVLCNKRRTMPPLLRQLASRHEIEGQHPNLTNTRAPCAAPWCGSVTNQWRTCRKMRLGRFVFRLFWD
jgi:hypothetical protein